MRKSIYLESENLVIRQATFDDCKYFDMWERKEYIKEFFTIEDTRNYEEIVEEFFQYEQDSSKIQLTIVLKDGMKPIGRIYISRLDEKLQSLDITRIYIGEEDFIGKGFGKEAMKLALKYVFEDLNMERVTLDTFDGNEKASKLYKSLGFIDEGVLRHATKKKGKFYNLNLKSMLKNEYEKHFLG